MLCRLRKKSNYCLSCISFNNDLACVASVSVGFSAARSRRFSLFGGAKIGASATLIEALFCAHPNFRAFKKRKMLQTCGKPYGNACYAGKQRLFHNICALQFLIRVFLTFSLKLAR